MATVWRLPLNSLELIDSHVAVWSVADYTISGASPVAALFEAICKATKILFMPADYG